MRRDGDNISKGLSCTLVNLKVLRISNLIEMRERQNEEMKGRT